MVLVACVDTANLNLDNSLQVTSEGSARANQAFHSGWHIRPWFSRAAAAILGLLGQVGQGRTVKQRQHLCFRNSVSHCQEMGKHSAQAFLCAVRAPQSFWPFRAFWLVMGHSISWSCLLSDLLQKFLSTSLEDIYLRASSSG